MNGTSLTVITTADVYENLAGTSTLSSYSAWFNKDASLENKYEYVGPNTHKFKITVYGCLRTDAGTATIPHLAIYKNGSQSPGARISPYLSVQNQDTSFPVGCIEELATNDTIEVMITSNDGDDILGDHIQLIAIAIN